MIISYATTIFLGAFLLFQIQLIIGKYILPWYGGTPGVWSTCMLFFQLILLGGYAGAHGLVKCSPKKQVLWQVGLLFTVLLVFTYHCFSWASPLLPDLSWQPLDNTQSIRHILVLLAASVGLASMVLATTSPLLQSWFAQRWPGRSPYRLYALSNLGSLLGLISYPFLLEPVFSLPAQAVFWTGAYLLFTACFTTCALDIWKFRRLSQADTPRPTYQDNPSTAPAPPALGRRQRFFWFMLPACGSMILLASTNRMCQDVAVVPLLWVLPLSLYLITFIISFDSPNWYKRNWYMLAFAQASILACLILLRGGSLSIVAQISAYAFIVFTGCMVCHGELTKLKPPESQLTSFYLTLAAGGATGGLMVGLIAPLIFNGYWEFHLSLWLGWILVIGILLYDRKSGFYGRHRIWVRVGLFTFLGVFELALLVEHYDYLEKTMVSTRNFYGVLRVEERYQADPAKHLRILRHGRITHGIQYLAPESRRKPATYYGEKSGLGLAIRLHPRRRNLLPEASSLHIGVVGLGVGTIAAYTRAGDALTLYEINPEVIRLAQSPDYFSYLSDTAAKVEIVPGDARLSLARELRAGQIRQFDILALDAFSSDAIPAHLLTKEAFEIYLAQLRKPDGIIAVHITNRHLDLRPVMAQLAHHFNLNAWYIHSQTDDFRVVSAKWVILTQKETPPIPEIVKAATSSLFDGKPIRLWTDDFSNILSVLR